MSVSQNNPLTEAWKNQLFLQNVLLSKALLMLVFIWRQREALFLFLISTVVSPHCHSSS